MHSAVIEGLKVRWNGGQLGEKQAQQYVALDVPMMFEMLSQLQHRIDWLEAIRRGYRVRYSNIKMVNEALKWKIEQLTNHGPDDDGEDPPGDGEPVL